MGPGTGLLRASCAKKKEVPMRAQSLQSCLTFCDPMDNSPPGSSVLWILQTRILEWVTMPSSRKELLPRGF